ncbi:hypothetical protein KP509_01G004300 [Ceratopteris richardii]|uniref:Uncharacterized protein n=1 Tax=Ceratopteris richardii TaxID=49495 RepID=A0A8T2VE43_CERRI|nr:hypothetical protein KP509_01G004300 [Ceratopteris richardii]
MLIKIGRSRLCEGLSPPTALSQAAARKVEELRASDSSMVEGASVSYFYIFQPQLLFEASSFIKLLISIPKGRRNIIAMAVCLCSEAKRGVVEYGSLRCWSDSQSSRSFV